METPGQFMPPAAPKKSNAALIIVLVVVGGCLLCCGGVAWYSYSFISKMKGTIGCTMHFTFARMAVKQYADAHDGHLPPAAKWQDAIAPYYSATANSKGSSAGKFFEMGDAAGDLGCPAGDGYAATGMAYNDALAGKTLTEVKKSPESILFFEVPKTGRNQHEKFVPQAGQSPQKLLGQPRHWITIPVQGSVNLTADTKTDEGASGL